MVIRNKKGFTLVELLVVIAIIAILAGVSIPLYSYFSKSTTERMLQEKAELYAAQAEVFNRDVNLDLLLYEDKAAIPTFDGSNRESVDIGVLLVFNRTYGGANNQIEAILTQDEWNEMTTDSSNNGVYLRLSYGTKVQIVEVYVIDNEMKVSYAI